MSSTSFGPRGFAGITADGYQQRVILVGSGSPEGVVAGDPGAIYKDSTAATFYHKLTGFAKTGWSAAQTGAAGSFTTLAASGTSTLAAVTGTSFTGTSDITTSTHLAAYNVLSVEANITCSGATSTASNIIPAGATLLGFGSRVTTLITSGAGTSFTLGDGTTADLYGSGFAFTAGTTTGSADYKTPLTPLAPASRTVTATCTGGTFTGGVIRCVVFYTTVTGPTS